MRTLSWEAWGPKNEVYVAALVGWLAEDDAIVNQINAHLRGKQITDHYWHQHSGEITYSAPGEGEPADSWPMLGGINNPPDPML